jgi:polyhydroxyalkanoate synthesis regulator phasin
MRIKSLGIVIMIVLALTVSSVSAQPGDRGRGRGAGMRAAAGLVQIVAEEVGQSPREVMEALRGGSTLAEIIAANGGSIEEVTAAAVEQAAEKINEAVENGRITQERADTILANLETRITSLLNLDPVENQQMRDIVRRIAGETGLSAREVFQQWQDGTSLGEILTANDEDVQTFIDETLIRAEERLAKAVATGRLTQEQADSRLASLRELLPNFLNEPFPLDEEIIAEQNI